jgi:Type IV leader peptidase family
MTVVAVAAAAVAGLAVGVVLARVVRRTPRLIEAATVVLFAAFAVRLGPDPALPAHCVLAAGLVVLAVVDAQTHRLPREVTYTTLAIGAPLLVVAALVDGEPQRLVDAAIGGVVVTGVFWLVYVVTRGGLGPGDVRLAPLLGVYLGYVSLATVCVGSSQGWWPPRCTGSGHCWCGAATSRTRSGRSSPAARSPRCSSSEPAEDAQEAARKRCVVVQCYRRCSAATSRISSAFATVDAHWSSSSRPAATAARTG